MSIASAWLSLKNALFGYSPVTTSNSNNKQVEKLVLINNIILIFKRSLYEMCSSRTSPSVFYVARRVKQIMEIEYQIAQTNCKSSLHFDKWELLIDTLKAFDLISKSLLLSCYALYSTV